MNTLVWAQDEMGYINSNYAGVNGLMLNPSFSVDSKLFVDIHLVGLDVFVHNNFAFMPKGTYSPLTLKIPSAQYNTDLSMKRANFNLDLMGPGAVVSWDRFSFGVFSRFRTVLDAKVPGALANLFNNNFIYQPYAGHSYSVPGYVNTMSWVEIGASFGYMFVNSSTSTIDVGVNIKRLIGVNSTSANLSTFDIDYSGQQTFFIDHTVGEYRENTPAWNIGQGFGGDIGINYQQKLEVVNGYRPNTKYSGCKHIDYKFKVGLSLLDVGGIFVSKNAIDQQFNYTNQYFNINNPNLSNWHGVDSYISGELYNNTTNNRWSGYWAMLPMSISGQFDYNFENHFYLNLTDISSFKIQNQVERINVIALTPRYETKYFEVAMPISLLNYSYPLIGVAVRLGNNFIIGSNCLDSFIGHIRDVYGADIYFNFKIALFRHCPKGSRKNTSKNVDVCSD